MKPLDQNIYGDIQNPNRREHVSVIAYVKGTSNPFCFWHTDVRLYVRQCTLNSIYNMLFNIHFLYLLALYINLMSSRII